MVPRSLTLPETALKRVMDTEGMDLEIIINPKAMNDGQAVIQVPVLSCYRSDVLLTTSLQLETAAGAAIKHFKGVDFPIAALITADN